MYWKLLFILWFIRRSNTKTPPKGVRHLRKPLFCFSINFWLAMVPTIVYIQKYFYLLLILVKNLIELHLYALIILKILKFKFFFSFEVWIFMELLLLVVAIQLLYEVTFINEYCVQYRVFLN